MQQAKCISFESLPWVVYSLDENHSVGLDTAAGHTCVPRVLPSLAGQPQQKLEVCFPRARMWCRHCCTRMKHSVRLPVEQRRPRCVGVGEMQTFHLTIHLNLTLHLQSCFLSEQCCCSSGVKNQISSGHPEGFELFSLVWVFSCCVRESSAHRLDFRPYSEKLLSLMMTTTFCSPILASAARPRMTWCHRQRRRRKTTVNHGQWQTAGEKKGIVKIRICRDEDDQRNFKPGRAIFVEVSYRSKDCLDRSEDVCTVGESFCSIITTHNISVIR